MSSIYQTNQVSTKTLQDVVDVLSQYLQRDAVGRRQAELDERAKLARSLQTLRGWLAALQRNSSSLIVVVVGEFNAGKSTLINAMLGTEAAFTDPFEATATTAYYIHDDGAGFVEIVPEHGSAERWELDAFLDACRRGGVNHLRRAEIHLRHGLPYILVDTCGMGTVNARNEGLAEAAVIDADVLVWLIDSNDILGVQEAAFLNRCRQTGMPLLIALGKADTFDNDAELNSTIANTASRLQLNPSDIFPVSPISHSLSAPEPGVAKLMKDLNNSSRDIGTVRKRSQRAKLKEAADEAKRALDAVAARLREHKNVADVERAVLTSQGQSVKDRVLAACRAMVSRSVREGLAGKFPDPLRQTDLDRLFESVAEYLNAAVTGGQVRIRELIQREAVEAWSQILDEQATDIERQITLLARRPEGQAQNIEHLREKVAGIATRRESIHRSASSDVAAWLLTAVAGIATAMTGEIEHLVRALHWMAERHSTHQATTVSEVVYPLADAINMVCESEVPQRVERDFEPVVSRYIDRIVTYATDAFCQRIAGCSVEEIRQSLNECEHLIAELTRV